MVRYKHTSIIITSVDSIDISSSQALSDNSFLPATVMDGEGNRHGCEGMQDVATESSGSEKLHLPTATMATAACAAPLSPQMLNFAWCYRPAIQPVPLVQLQQAVRSPLQVASPQITWPPSVAPLPSAVHLPQTAMPLSASLPPVLHLRPGAGAAQGNSPLTTPIAYYVS